MTDGIPTITFLCRLCHFLMLSPLELTTTTTMTKFQPLGDFCVFSPIELMGKKKAPLETIRTTGEDEVFERAAVDLFLHLNVQIMYRPLKHQTCSSELFFKWYCRPSPLLPLAITLLSGGYASSSFFSSPFLIACRMPCYSCARVRR